MTARPFNLDGFAIHRPPDLSPEHLSPFISTAKAEIARLKATKMREIAEREHVQLVLAEAWLTHLDEFYISTGCPPFRGNVDTYIERLVVDAARDIHGFLTASVPVWGPGMSHP